MTGRLIIDHVHAERFGGLSNTGLALGGHPFLVVHGANESGKTTFATLVSWLLVGPTDDHAASMRFGRPTEQLSGRLTGTLNGEALRIDATYKLLQKGLPNTSGVAVHHAGQQLNLDAWRAVLGGIDPKVLTATYRMWGADLHADAAVLAEVTQAALAGLGGSARIGDVLAKLRDQAAAVLTAKAEGTESFATLNARRSALEGDIRGIAANADEFRNLQDRQDRVAEQLRNTVSLIAALNERQAAIVTLQSVARERSRERAVREELDQLPQLPDVWATIVDDVAGFTTAAHDVDRAVEHARSADLAATTAAAQAGVTDDEARALRVTHTTVTAVQVKLTQLETARTQAGTAQAALRSADDAAEIARVDADRALAACPEVQADVLRSRPLTDTDVRQVRSILADWATAERQITTATTAVSAQQSQVTVTTAARQQAHDRWERFGTGISAQQWRVTPPPPAKATTTAPVKPWPAIAVAGVVALAAVLVLPRWVALAVTAAAFAGVIVALGRTRTVAAAAPVTTSPPPEAQADLVDAANAVVAAEATVDAAERDLQRAQAELDRWQRDADTPRRTVDDQCTPLGFRAANTPEATADLIDRVLAASVAVTAVSAAQHLQDRSRRDVLVADEAVTQVLDDLAVILTDAQVPERLPCEPTASNVDVLRQVTDLVAQLQTAERAADQAREVFEALLAPLGSEATERSRASLVAEAQRLGALHTQRQALLDERNTLNHTINTRFSERPAAKALSSLGRTDAEWAADVAQVVDELHEAESQRDELNRERGEVQLAMEQLLNRDELSAKRLELGSVAERADEQLLAGVVLTAARTLLARTAAERRRTHQPALVSQASRLLSSVAGDWQQLLVDPHDDGSADVTVVDTAGAELATTRLSTGARALTHLSLRLATAELDAQRRRVRFPIICDDPLVHLDDERALAVMPLLAQAARDGHQVIVFTCHGRTVEAGRVAGAHVVDLG